MTIHRVGPQPDATPARLGLGRVLDTIDDLGALMDIMRQDVADPDLVRVYFCGGYFTEPDNLRLLSLDPP